MTARQGLDRSHWTLAFGLVAAVTALWIKMGWSQLAFGRLPDTDDMMRLAQVRDWLAGQPFTDIVQHRLGRGASGSMHWSRIGDVGPAALMLALRPLLGTAAGDAWAAMLWPAVLLCAYVLASARLALRLFDRSHVVPAIVLAVAAMPATSMFVPGRIDHHGLQIVLVVLLIDALVRPPSTGSGLIAGLITATCLAVGLETAPQCAAAMAVLGSLWVARGSGERDRLLAFASTLAAATLIWFLLAKPAIWPNEWCDGFTPASFDATLIAAFALGAAVAATAPLANFGWRGRVGFAVVAGVLTLAAVHATSSVCLAGPYGHTDPLLRRLWMDRIDESQSLVVSTMPVVIGLGGLALAGSLAGLVLAAQRRGPLVILVALQLVSLLVGLVQVRGLAMAAALTPPIMAHLVVVARSRSGPTGPIALAAAWIGGLGFAWSLTGALLTPDATPTKGAACSEATTLRQMAALPPSTILAPIDAGAYLIAATRHRVLSAPYHRNNAGNRAAYDIWLSTPERARPIVQDWGIGYVLWCPAGLGPIDLAREGPGGMAQLLHNGQHPVWLAPVPLKNSQGVLYRVLPAATLRR